MSTKHLADALKERAGKASKEMESEADLDSMLAAVDRAKGSKERNKAIAALKSCLDGMVMEEAAEKEEPGEDD